MDLSLLQDIAWKQTPSQCRKEKEKEKENPSQNSNQPTNMSMLKKRKEEEEEKKKHQAPSLILNAKFTITAANSANVNTVGPKRSSNPLTPRTRIVRARQWNVASA